MIYQNPLKGIHPYVAKYSMGKNGFPSHKHHEIEVIYCLNGYRDIDINGVTCRVNPGEAIVIGSAVPHLYHKCFDDSLSILIEIGPVFLQEKFHHISDLSFSFKKFTPNNGADDILSCIQNFKNLFDDEDTLTHLLIVGKLYELFVLLVRNLSKDEQNGESEEHDELSKIDKALSMVHERYNDQLTIDDAASACGYGKSNFCRVFKNVMGVSFHQYLNNYRVENAKYLLVETTMPLERISVMVGFQDAKVFCRVFKSFTNKTPGRYRKSPK